MDYTEIKTTALGYSDREDAETISNMDRFLRIVESRVNRRLRVRKMSVRATVPLLEDQEHYGLPEDFAGFRDVKVYDPDTPKTKVTLNYLIPNQMNALSGIEDVGDYYTIVADQIQILPPKKDWLMEILYYQRLLPLSTTNKETWLSRLNPDVYVFGLLVEISSFTKDSEAKKAWDDRFKESVVDLVLEDKDDRWSGTPLTIKLG